MSPSQALIPISDNSMIGEARRQVARIAAEASFDEADRGKAAIIASELATNLTRYATGGEIHIQSGSSGDAKWIEILSIDRGPGISNIDNCLTDGFSTGGTPGTGLGAAQRMASDFEIYSTQPGGTVIFTRLRSASAPASNSPFAWGAISRPAPYESLCGDQWSICERLDKLAVMIVDGLGHGPEAAKAAKQATDVFEGDPFGPLTSIVNTAHGRMQGTRGGAMAIAHLDAATGGVKYTGVGNIAGCLRGASGKGDRGLVSHNGTVGAQIRKVQEFDYECPVPGLFIMHSDGLQSRWSLDAYPGLSQCHPAIVAGILYRDFTRGRDDVTVAVIRILQSGRHAN